MPVLTKLRGEKQQEARAKDARGALRPPLTGARGCPIYGFNDAGRLFDIESPMDKQAALDVHRSLPAFAGAPVFHARRSKQRSKRDRWPIS